MTFYLLSLITGVLECGWIAHGAVHSLPLWKILCYPLAYHAGNLFPKPFSLSRRCLSSMGALALLTAGLSSARQFSENAVFVLTCVSLFLLSAVIQSVRSGLKSDGNRLMKRIFRVGGFALAPLAAAAPTVILTISSLTALFALRNHHSRFGFSKLTDQRGFSLVMIFHQLHYFFYAHITLSAMSLLLSRESSIGVFFAALLFCGTWVTYMSVEPLVSKLTSRVLPVFYAGHIGISLLLLIMSFTGNTPLFTVFWLITGFGGGAVYTISARAKSAGGYDKDSMTIAENIGHTLGLLAATVTAAISGSHSPRIMLISGSVSAMLAVISMSLISRKENRYETVHGHS